MSDDLLTTLVFKVKADGVETDISSMKRSLSSLGTHVKTITDATNKALSEVGTDSMPGTKGVEKASKAIIKQTGEIEKAIATFGSAASTGLKSAYKSIESEEVRLRGMGIDPAIMNPYLAKLGEVQKLTAAVASQERTLAQEVAKGATLESQQIEHTLELKRQIAGVNQANATKRAAELKEELALTNQINEAALSKKYGGSAKPVAYYEEKAGASASSPAVSAALSNLKVQQDAARAESAIIANAIAENSHYQGLKTQHAAYNKTLADQEISSTKARAAALAAYYTEAQNAELNLIHTGRSKSAAMLTDKGQRLGFTDAEISAAVAGLKKVEAANAAAFAASNPHIDQLKKNAEAAGTSVKGLSASMRNVPAQFTDIIVSLQGGQAPLTVLLQQGGQLKDMFGGVGNAGRALGGYVMGLVNPFTVAAVAVGTLGIAYMKGAAEGEAYNKALILTGNAAGVTAGQLAEMAQSVAKTTGGTVGSSAEALAALAGTSNIASAQFEKVAATAVMMEKATGTAVGETVKQFAELGKDPLQASLRLNETTHFLTLSVYEQIKALTDQGRTLEAGVVAQNAFYDVNQQRTAPLLENLSRATQAYKILAGWIGKVADAAKDPFRTPDIEADLAKQIAIREGWVRNKFTGQVDATDKTLIALKEQLEYHKHIAASNKDRAEWESASALAVQEKTKWDEKGSSFATKQDKMTRELTAAAVQGQKMLIDGTITQIELEKRFANIREQYKPEKGPSAKVEQDYYATILKSISGFNEAALLELDTSHKLTESDKFRIKTLGDISAEMEKQIKLANGDTKKINIAIDGAVNAESLMHEAELLKAQVELRKGAAAAAKAGLDDYKEINTEEAKRITALHAGQKTIEDFVIATNEASDAIKFESEVTGLSAENQKIAIEQYKVAIELRKELRKIELNPGFAPTLSQDGTYDSTAQEKAKADMVAAYAAKSADATKRIQLDSQQKLVTQYSSIFQKGFVDMVNGGTDTWDAFTKSLETTFKTTVADQLYKTFAEPIVIKFVASMVGLVGTAANAVGIGDSAGGTLMSGFSAASNAKSAYSVYNGGYAAGYNSFATSAAGQSMGLGTAATEGFSYAGGAGFAGAEVAGTSASTTALGASIGEAIPYIGWFIAAVGILSQMGPTSSRTLGSSKASYGADGELIGTEALDGLVHRPSDQVRADYAKELANPTPWQYDMGKRGSPNVALERELASSLAFEKMSTGADVQAKNLAELYFNAAKTLDIKAAAASFSFASNTGQSGEHPNASFGVSIGGKSYNSGEAAFADPEVVKLSASRTILEALKASELPKYLAGVFDGLTTSTATKAQIDDTMKLATSYKTLHDQLQALPFEYLKDMSFAASKGLIAAAGTMENLGSLLGGYVDNFYTAEEKKAQLTKNTTAAFEKMGIVMPALDESARAWYRSEVDRLGAMDMSVAANASAYTSVLSLSGAMNTLVPAAKEASKALEDTAKTLLDAATKSASDAYSALERAVSSQSDALAITRDLASEQVAAIGSVFDVLKTNVDALYGQVGSTASMQAEQGNAFIAQALAAAQSTGYLPDSAALTDAITAARSGADSAVYASQQDSDFARLVLAGKLSALKDISGEQLTGAKKALVFAQSQVDALDGILSNAKLQLDAANGIDVSVLSVVDAVRIVNDSIQVLINAQSLSADSARLDSISTYIKSIYDTTSVTTETNSLKAISDTSKQYGVSLADVARSMGFSLESMIALYKKFGVEWKSAIGLEGSPALASIPKLPVPKTPIPSVSVGGVGDDGYTPAIKPKYSSTTDMGGWGSSTNYITDPAAVSRLDSVNAYVNTLDFSAANKDASVATLYATAQQYGVSQYDLALATGYSAVDIAALFSDRGLPSFDVGTNYVPRDMIAQIHEGEAIIPKAYNPAAGGGNNQRLESLVEGLTKEVQRLQSIVNDGNTHARRTADATNGNPDRPVLVEIAS